MKSLTRQFLVSIALTTLSLTVLAAAIAALIFQSELAQRQVAFLGDYVRERSLNLDRRFAALTTLQLAAAKELERRALALEPREAERLADQYFPLRPDGTRRSRPEYYDGVRRPDGGFVYGMGAFIAQAEATPPEELAALAASFSVVSDLGQAAGADLDNLYFFTPATRLVMFGPKRPDRLMFYREQAPADLDVSGEEMTLISLPANNPNGETRCTSLQRLVQEADLQLRLGSACLTPAYIDGRFVGAFGSSIELSGLFLSAVRETLPGATAMIMTRDGEIIADEAFGLGNTTSESQVKALEEQTGTGAIAEAIRTHPERFGVLDSPDGTSIIAFGRLNMADWNLLLVYPKRALMISAARSASWVLLLGGIAAVLQALLMIYLAHRHITGPVRRLADSCDPDLAPPTLSRLAADEARQDEIGLLARALARERAKAESARASLEDRVRERTAELEQANAEKSRFLANMSHELRTPLNGVIAISQALKARQVDPKDQELAELIVSSGRLLEQVLTDILDFSSIEAGRIHLAREAFEIEPLVARIAELHRAAAAEKGLKLEWTVEPDVQGAYLGDPVRLTQVLSNLFSNAVKFTPSGRVSLTVSRRGRALEFAVRDTGIGFDEVVRARLFRRFEQADDSIRRRFGGTGLGLAISRSLVELMGGEITVSSKPGEGSEFCVLLELPRAEPSSEMDEPAAGETDAAPLGALRILLAEDHPTNQKVVQLILGAVDLTPVVVGDGQAALDAMAAEPFDVVLMDMQMPVLDGLSATAEIRRREAALGRPRTPVIMLTANALEEHVQAGQAAGGDWHLSKPIRAEDLLGAIAAVTAPPDDPQKARA
ncbi:ATP-binding protein [Phenylobacterium sp.]|jgi:signal transduction histidine kinase/CheY-like chemotaxis protein|uniref:ATP-binding protein n=1 Tax=Phenylobacterium sp. TaxID=1871053 RepID=UPI000C8BF4F6|nr:ATP-binding protein [Phenylobacterium sp.]MAK83256.1 hybrid sensor histidine kinase/response regulator [Phenylobacterium sp.]|tara:strand:- start:62813 stop:65320 length:2508 start_codon:yes stop_codon:yes gene_type:complete